MRKLLKDLEELKKKSQNKQVIIFQKNLGKK